MPASLLAALSRLAARRATPSGVHDAYVSPVGMTEAGDPLGLGHAILPTHRKIRTEGCSFDDVLELTSPLKRTDVIDQYCPEQELSAASEPRCCGWRPGTVPWFVALSPAVSFLSSIAAAATGLPLIVCDPAFVAEMPGSGGMVLRIGHFDEVGGITHVEI